MLFHKMLRDFRKNFGAFFSVFLLSALAMALFCTFEGHVLSQNVAREKYHQKCNLSDVWVYGESFSEEQLEKIRSLDFVQSAQLRTVVKGTTPDYDGVQVDMILEDENTVNTPYYISGEKFDPADQDGIWIANAFAKRRNLHVGDTFTMEYNGATFTRTIKGLIESPEYEFRQADGDADMYLENIAIVYMAEDSVPYTQMVIRTKDQGALEHEDAIAKALDYNYSAMIDRSSVPGLARLDSELDQHQSFSYMFVVIFVGIAVLVIATTMNRMVAKQRTQIGTLNALGMKRWKVLFHYVSFSLLVSVSGVIAGLLSGILWGCPAVMGMFAEWYIVPGLHSVFHPMYLIIALAVVLVCVLSAYLSCRKILRIRPAEALRPAPPRQGKRCIFEKLPFWKRLSFNSQYNLRDISRAKLRTFMCIVGTAVGMLMMLYGTGCGALVSTMVDMNFERTAVAEYQTKLSSNAKLSDLDALSDSVGGELVMQDAVEISKIKNASSKEKKKETITVLEGKHLYNILDVNNQITDLVPGTVGLSRKLAEDMDIKVGDTIYWHLYSKNTWYKAKVGMIYRCSETQGIAMLRQDYEKTNAGYTPTLLMSNRKPKDIKEKAYVDSVTSKEEMKKAYEKSMEMVNLLVYMMIGFSALMIIVVLYNSGSLSFNERMKELATLKVMGFRSGRIRQLLNVQNLWLSVIGIVIGIPLGNVSLNAMMNSNGENFDYMLNLPIYDYVLSGVLVLLVSMLVSFMFSKRIRRLDMVEVLKGCE